MDTAASSISDSKADEDISHMEDSGLIITDNSDGDDCE